MRASDDKLTLYITGGDRSDFVDQIARPIR